MNNQSEILEAVNRAIEALSDLKAMLEQEPDKPEAPAEEPAALELPDAVVTEEPAPIELVAPDKPEPAEEAAPVELVQPEPAEKAPEETIELSQPESVTAAEKRKIELVLTDPETILEEKMSASAEAAPAVTAAAPEQNMTCPRCGKEIDHGFKFCMYCGQKLETAAAPLTCKACGKQIRPGNRFCVYCGTPVER